MKRAVICFTRVPVPGKTKTRLMPLLGGKNCARLHTAFLQDLAGVYRQLDADLFVAYAPEPHWERTLGSGWTTPSAGCLRGGMRPVC